MQLVPKRPSLVFQTVSIIKDGIRHGIWKEYLPAESTLCERMQVSRVTLRAALEQLEREGWCTAGQGRRRRIKEHPQDDPRAPSDVVNLLSPLPLQSLPSSAIFWVDALRDHLAAAGFRLHFLASQAAFSQNPGRVLENLVHETRPAGWVLYLSNAAQQQWFSDRALPCVVSGSCHPGVELSSVDIDYAATCAHSVGLLSSRGRKQLALLMPHSGQAGNLESERGFMDALGRSNIARGKIAHHDGTVKNICSVLDRLLQASEPTDGLLVAKPAHVITALTHLLRSGVRLPRDISLISRDEDPMLEHLVPVVTRYHTDPAAFARKISRMVIARVSAGDAQPHKPRLMPTLFKGETLE